MGLFDGIFRKPGGILGGDATSGTGPFASGIRDHRAALLMASLGMLSGRTPAESFANAANGIQAGVGLDQNRKTKAAYKSYFDANPGILPPGAGDLVGADPELGRTIIANRLAPKVDTSPTVHEFLGDDGKVHVRQWNAATSKWDEAGIAPPSAGSADANIRNDPNGVPRYVTGPNAGKPVFPGIEPDAGPKGPFAGKGLAAQSLNWLVNLNKSDPAKGLTEEQAAQIGAGHQVTGPDGSIYFMTPEGIISSSADGATNPDGSPGGYRIAGPKSYGTEEQTKNAGFAKRMLSADDIIGKFQTAGTDVGNSLLSGIPILGNYMVSKDYQQLDQAERDFVNAVLRRESGAAISPSEFENARKQYFPQPGDERNPAVLEQKAANRKTAIEALKRSAGPLSADYLASPPAAASPAAPTAAGGPPAGVDPDLWAHMTPEERALWK